MASFEFHSISEDKIKNNNLSTFITLYIPKSDIRSIEKQYIDQPNNRRTKIEFNTNLTQLKEFKNQLEERINEIQSKMVDVKTK